MFGKVVSDTKDVNIIPLKIVTIAKQSNLKPTEIKPSEVKPDETVSKSISSPTPEPVNEESQAQAEPTEIAEKAPAFNLDDFSKMVENARNDNPQSNQQKELAGEREQAQLAQIGIGEQTDLTVNPTDYIRAKMEPCWLIDKGAKNYQTLRIEIVLILDEQGEISMLRIANDSQIIASANNGWRAARDNVVAALNECAPYGKLKSLAHKEWKTMKLNFQPRDT